MQHVNPFDETFRRAVESKCSATTPNQNDVNHLMMIETLKETETLHTPNVGPCFDISATDCTKYTSTLTSNHSTTIIQKSDSKNDCCKGIIADSNADGTSDFLNSIKMNKRTAEKTIRMNQIRNKQNKICPLVLPKISNLFSATNQIVTAHPKYIRLTPKVTSVSTPVIKNVEYVSMPQLVQLQFVTTTTTNAQTNESIDVANQSISTGRAPHIKIINQQIVSEPKTVREKLKESILRNNQQDSKSIEAKTVSIPSPATTTSTTAVSTILPEIVHSSTSNKKKETLVNKNKTIDAAAKTKLFERNRAAAKRYRFVFYIKYSGKISTKFYVNKTT